MFSKIDAVLLDFEDTKCTLMYEKAKICPRCNKGLQPIGLSAAVYSHKIYGENFTYATVLNFCTICQNCFISSYEALLCDRKNGVYKTTNIRELEPLNTFEKRDFSSYINNLSLQFVETYNQAEIAEASKLNQISGMGYRKALEFLIKDYAIHFYPNKKEEIESSALMNCIKNYIDNTKIQTLAENLRGLEMMKRTMLKSMPIETLLI
ncbi:MAG: hypothetical protein NC203_00535 [Firmicutes bacterium]|nr:hypothetical protein [[Eubacterium] siraeum]MCM1486826.1 hypothetical protein [Bacillota bacterium]